MVKVASIPNKLREARETKVIGVYVDVNKPPQLIGSHEVTAITPSTHLLPSGEQVDLVAKKWAKDANAPFYASERVGDNALTSGITVFTAHKKELRYGTPEQKNPAKQTFAGTIRAILVIGQKLFVGMENGSVAQVTLTENGSIPTKSAQEKPLLFELRSRASIDALYEVNGMCYMASSAGLYDPSGKRVADGNVISMSPDHTVLLLESCSFPATYSLFVNGQVTVLDVGVLAEDTQPQLVTSKLIAFPRDKKIEIKELNGDFVEEILLEDEVRHMAAGGGTLHIALGGRSDPSVIQRRPSTTGSPST